MQLEMLVEAVQPDEALERGGLHLRDVLEAQVVGDQRGDLRGILIRESEPPANLLRHARADLDVLVEPDAAVGPGGRREGGRLADVVQQDAPGQSWRAAGGKAFEHHERVNPDVSFGMKLRRLLDALHPRDFGQKLGQQPRFVEQLEAAARGAFGEQLGEFVAQALGGNLVDFRRELDDRAEGARFDRVAEPRGEAHGAHHAQLVFPKRCSGRPMARMIPGAEIVAPADEIEHFDWFRDRAAGR